MTVFVNGKFDILHSGHFNLLMYCRQLADPNGKLVVAIDTDSRIMRANTIFPIFHQDVRILNLAVLKMNGKAMIDHIAVFETDDDLRQVINMHKPTFMVKGDDWEGKEIIGAELVKRVLFYKTEKNGIADKISSSAIVKTILSRYGK